MQLLLSFSHALLPSLFSYISCLFPLSSHTPSLLLPYCRYGNDDDYSSPIDDVDELLVFAVTLSNASQRYPVVFGAAQASLSPEVQAQVCAMMAIDDDGDYVLNMDPLSLSLPPSFALFLKRKLACALISRLISTLSAP